MIIIIKLTSIFFIHILSRSPILSYTIYILYFMLLLLLTNLIITTRICSINKPICNILIHFQISHLLKLTTNFIKKNPKLVHIKRDKLTLYPV